MLKPKIIKAVILGISFMALFSSTVLAGTGKGQSPVLPAPDQPVASQSMVSQGTPPEDGPLFQKQREIDQYVFEQHKAEIEQKGFIVTHTGQIGDYVEVGITPYSAENANYLYGLFGRDMVKVVEGQKAELLAGAAETTAAQAVDANTTMARGDSQKNGPIPIALIYTAGGVIVLGGIVALSRRRKLVR